MIIRYDLFKLRQVISDLNARISSFAMSDQFYDEYELALYEYFEWRDISLEGEEEFSDDFFQDEDEFIKFLSWYCNYFVTDEYNKNFPELYMQCKRNRLSALELEMLRSFAESFLSVYEVQKVDPGKGMEVKDIFHNDVFYVIDDHLSRKVFKWDLLYAGLVGARGMFFLGGFTPVVMPPRLISHIERGICEIFEAEKKVFPTLKEFLRLNSAEVYALVEESVDHFDKKPAIKNADGESLLFVTFLYHVRDTAALIEKLDRMSVFVRDRIQTGTQGELIRADYIWIKKRGGRNKIWENTIRGLLFLEKNMLRVKCNSRERAEKIRVTLSRLFGDMVELKMAIYDDPEDTPQGAAIMTPTPPVSLADKCEDPESRDMLKEIVHCHYKNWVHEKLPAIGNITPMEAIETPHGKRILVELLKELENQNERAIRKGIRNADILAFPADMIRKELGLS